VVRARGDDLGIDLSGSTPVFRSKARTRLSLSQSLGVLAASISVAKATKSPPRVGNRVEVDLPLRYRGLGTVLEKSTEITRGRGTKLYPTYRVALDDGTTEWCTGSALTKVR
jgi:hypothetical protein